MKSRSFASVLLVVLTGCSGGADAVAPTPDASGDAHSAPSVAQSDDDAGAPTRPVVTSDDAGVTSGATAPQDAGEPSPGDAAPDSGPGVPPEPPVDAGEAMDGASPVVDAGPNRVDCRATYLAPQTGLTAPRDFWGCNGPSSWHPTDGAPDPGGLTIDIAGGGSCTNSVPDAVGNCSAGTQCTLFDPTSGTIEGTGICQ